MSHRFSHWSLVIRHSFVIGHWAFVILSSLVIGHSSFAAEVKSPLEPAEAHRLFQLADSNLQIELAAAEPDVIDPVAIRFDEDGRMWVVEMRDYPLGVPEGPISRIRVLEDRDGDGRFETATIFADKLRFATGLQPWKGGVFVTLAGALVYMKDTDSDGRADVNETWFEGFAELNSQLRANHPRLALDNWIYVANGLRGGRVVNRKLPDQSPINISGMDFRFDPQTGKAEAVSGNGQFGLCFDDWGNRFTCSNRNPVRHVVIEDRYLKASPGVTVPAVVSDVAAWGEQSRIFPISRAWTTSNLHAGQFTAACGVYIYRGDLLPAEFKGNVFTCDPTGNLIHREIMQPAGPTFTSKPAYEGKDFLCSPDEWFRPVNMELGPDGALYVVDMYRCVIEHPDFVPDELKKRPDQRFGDDRGRIWRIVPKVGRSGPERPASRIKPGLSKATPEELVSLLEQPNAWQRETAQRLLLERNERALTAALRSLAERSSVSQARVAAAWLLTAYGVAQPEFLFEASDSQVRRQACRIDENLSRGFGDVSRLHNDKDLSVRFQARLSAPGATLDEMQLADYVREEAADPWLRASIRLHVSRESRGAYLVRDVMNKARQRNDELTAEELILVRELLGDLRRPIEEARDAIRELADNALKELRDKIRVYANAAVLSGVARTLARRSTSIADISDAAQLAKTREVLPLLVKDHDLPAAARREIVEFIGYLPDPTSTLLDLALNETEQAIRIAAIATLARLPGILGWEDLLKTFASDTPPVRRAIVYGLLANTDRTKLLLDAIEAGRIKASELDLQQAKRLTEHRDAAIKERAAKLFAAATPADRAKALADYQPVLKMSGDAKRGQVIFEKNCAVCHRIAGIGVNVAPDISDSRTKKLEQLLADILQPNRAIDNNYIGYSVRMLDGTVLTGILTAETATSITLRQQGGKDAVIARSEIDELRSSGVSLMPEGLERQIPPQDMADLLSFIKNWRYLDGRTPLSGEQ
jgi:putative membrane-bound dehydrogenase-like protein